MQIRRYTWDIRFGVLRRHISLSIWKFLVELTFGHLLSHTGQCKRTGGCYNELVVAFYSTGGGVKGKKIYTCRLIYLFINLHLFYL